MGKIAFHLSYRGTNYHGWQRQNNAISIQEVIETAIQKTCGVKVALSGCGRTDAGVHAKNYITSVRLDTNIPLEKLPYALNARLPEDIVIHKAWAVPDDFDARFSCKCKEYSYYIHNRRTRDPFVTDRAYFYPVPLDVKAMQLAADAFVGKQDFAAVKSEGTPVRSTVRTIYYCKVEELEDGLIRIRVCADGFLYNMVRAIAGTLLYCGNGKLDPGNIPAILQSCDREQSGPTAPACGLYMTALTYGLEEIDDITARKQEE